MTQRLGRGIALLFHDHGIRRAEWSAARPARTLPPGKTRYPFYRRLGGPHGRSGRAENLVPTGIRSRTVQPIAQSLHRLSYPAHYMVSSFQKRKLAKFYAGFTTNCLAIGRQISYHCRLITYSVGTNTKFHVISGHNYRQSEICFLAFTFHNKTQIQSPKFMTNMKHSCSSHKHCVCTAFLMKQARTHTIYFYGTTDSSGPGPPQNRHFKITLS